MDILSLFWKQDHEECMKKCMELLSDKKELSLSKQAYLYRCWLACLQENQDLMGIHKLTTHILTMGNIHPPGPEKNTYLSLALIGLTVLGRFKAAEWVYLRIKDKARSPVSQEAFALFRVESSEPFLKNQGIKDFRDLIKKEKVPFFSLWTAIQVLKNEKDYFNALLSLKRQYPQCPEPFLVAAQHHMVKKEYALASRQWLKLLKGTPQHREALLQLSFCYVKLGEFLMARNILRKKSKLFLNTPLKSDFYYQLAKVNFYLFKRFGREAQGFKSLKYLGLALPFFKAFGHELTPVLAMQQYLIHSLNSEPRKQSWLKIVEASQVSKELQEQGSLMACPDQIPTHTRFFLASLEEKSLKIWGYATIKGGAVSDGQGGSVTYLNKWHRLPQPMEKDPQDLHMIPYFSKGQGDFYHMIASPQLNQERLSYAS